MSDLSQMSNDMVLTQAVTNLATAADALERVGKSTQRSAAPAAPRRGLSRTEAALYVGVSATTFDGMVKAKSMPKPIRIGSRRVWDVRALDAAFDALTAPNDANPWDAWG